MSVGYKCSFVPRAEVLSSRWSATYGSVSKVEFFPGYCNGAPCAEFYSTREEGSLP